MYHSDAQPLAEKGPVKRKYDTKECGGQKKIGTQEMPKDPEISGASLIYKAI